MYQYKFRLCLSFESKNVTVEAHMYVWLPQLNCDIKRDSDCDTLHCASCNEKNFLVKLILKYKTSIQTKFQYDFMYNYYFFSFYFNFSDSWQTVGCIAAGVTSPPCWGAPCWRRDWSAAPPPPPSPPHTRCAALCCHTFIILVIQHSWMQEIEIQQVTALAKFYATVIFTCLGCPQWAFHDQGASSPPRSDQVPMLWYTSLMLWQWRPSLSSSPVQRSGSKLVSSIHVCPLTNRS